MNWKSYVEKQNAKAFVLPSGWDSRETIAEQLGCAPDRVREHLQPGIAAKEIESRQFAVWDSRLGRKTTVTAYRVLSSGQSAEAGRQPARASNPQAWSEDDKAMARSMRAKDATYREIAQRIGRTPLAVKRWFFNHK